MAHLTFHEVLTAIRGGPKLARDNCERRLEHTCKNVNRRSGPSCRRIQQHPKKNDDNHHSRDDSPMIYRGQRPRGRPHRMRGLEGHCDKQHHENECTKRGPPPPGLAVCSGRAALLVSLLPSPRHRRVSLPRQLTTCSAGALSGPILLHLRSLRLR